MPPEIPNTANEPEGEARSRKANALDAFGVAVLLLLILWPLAFGWGVLGHTSWVKPAAHGALFLLFVWAVLGSPLWHRDSAESLGLGSPARLYRFIRDRRGSERWWAAGTFVIVFGGLLFFCLVDWPDAARFFRLPKPYRVEPASLGQWMTVALFGICGAGLVTTCAMRYDNLGSAFKLALKISLPLLAYAVLLAWLHRGEKAFSKFELRSHALDASAHMFWGLIQQFVFTGYFATRLRKAFGPANGVRNVIRAEKRLLAVLLGALLAAVLLGPAVWAALRGVHGAKVPISLLAGCVGFALPLGAVWTYFFCRDKKRMLVATLAGSFFGVIHIDSYGLVLVTGILGTIFAYAAMEDRFRNLAAFAFVHGLLGATLIKLFAAKGILHISLSVGPWSVRQPTATVLWVPMLCLAGYGAMVIWAARRPRAHGLAEGSRQEQEATSC